MKKRIKYPTPGSLPTPVKPFGSINLEKDLQTKEISVTAQVLLDRLVDDEGKDIEGASFGLALDASQSMKSLYGTPGVFGATPNYVEPVAKAMLNFLCGYSGTGTVNFNYWAIGPGGSEIETVGEVGASQIAQLKIRPQKNMGTGTRLMPIISHFVDGVFKNSKWAMGIIVTDGLIDDMEEVEEWTENYAVEVSKGNKKLVKLVLIGLGEQVNVEQLDRLDNFEASVDVDIWSAKLASEMEELYEIFDEVMSENLIIAPSGKILDNKGVVLRNYNDGLPAKLEFLLKKDSTSFTLEVPGQDLITQDLSEGLNLLK